MKNCHEDYIDSIYKILTDQYGPAKWEPRFDPISELVFTILSQHTSDINSFRAYYNLIEVFPDWELVENANANIISNAIWMGGLSRIKAPRIKAVLKSIRSLRGNLDLSFLADLSLFDAKRWLCDLPGIGPKTAAVVLCFALGLPTMPVDTHIHRVTKRLGLIGAKVSADKAHDILDELIPQDKIFSLHVYFITHGRQVCKARKPLCNNCNLATLCPSAFSANGP
tara:strand:- start:2020 stop:2694 length:675 start_codon:yes stop_codon:yes gene_type:complete